MPVIKFQERETKLMKFDKKLLYPHSHGNLECKSREATLLDFSKFCLPHHKFPVLSNHV